MNRIVTTTTSPSYVTGYDQSSVMIKFEDVDQSFVMQISPDAVREIANQLTSAADAADELAEKHRGARP
jgi:hypothetical protein